MHGGPTGHPRPPTTRAPGRLLRSALQASKTRARAAAGGSPTQPAALEAGRASSRRPLLDPGHPGGRPPSSTASRARAGAPTTTPPTSSRSAHTTPHHADAPSTPPADPPGTRSPHTTGTPHHPANKPTPPPPKGILAAQSADFWARNFLGVGNRSQRAGRGRPGRSAFQGHLNRTPIGPWHRG